MELVSCCGIMCSECPVYIATVQNDDSMKRFLAMEYSTGEQKFYPKDIMCLGCHAETTGRSKFGKDCQIRKCCIKEKVKICAECEKFPCSLTGEYIPEDSEHMDRLKEMHGVVFPEK